MRVRRVMAALLPRQRRATRGAEAPHMPEGLLAYYGSIEAYLEEQRRCAVYAMDRELRERRAA